MHFRILKMIVTSGFLTALECTKSIFGRGSAPDPTGGAYSAPPDPLGILLLREGRRGAGKGREGKGKKREGKRGKGRGRRGGEGKEGMLPTATAISALGYATAFCYPYYVSNVFVK